METAEHALRGITHRHVLPPFPRGTGGATEIGSERASQVKLWNGLTWSRGSTIFAVPHRGDRTPATSTAFSWLWVGHRPMRNSEERTRRSTGRAGKAGVGGEKASATAELWQRRRRFLQSLQPTPSVQNM